MEDFFVIDIPVFIPAYDKKKQYGWSRHYNELWDLLKETAGGYCNLTDCVPNLGLACSNCNEKYKRKGEKKRKLPLKYIRDFEEGVCDKFDCKEPCGRFKKLRMEYIRLGKIIPQPFEARSMESGHVLRLQYDLLKCQYISAKDSDAYDKEELEIIQNHIELFGLNKPERKNYEVGKYCKNVIDFHSFMQDIEYNNLVVDLLRKKLMKLDIKKAIKICRIIYSNAWKKLNT